MRVVGECFFWYQLTRVFPDKFHRAVKRLCVVCVCVCFCSVLAAVTDGRVVELEIDSNTVDGHVKRQHHIHTVQTAMANSISSIGQSDECLTSVKLDLEAKDYILGQLAIAGSLLHSHSASSIHCNIAASADDSSSSCCQRISASVSNRANFTLGRSWTFLLSVSLSAQCCSCDDHHMAANSHCKSSLTDSRSSYTVRDVSGLSPGMTESLSLVVHSSAVDSPIVETALIYSPVNPVDAATQQISVPLSTQVFDILDFVQPALPPTKHLCSSTPVSIASECHRLQQLCRPQIRNDSDSVSVDQVKSQNRIAASVKEHVMSLYASKSSNMPGTYACYTSVLRWTCYRNSCTR